MRYTIFDGDPSASGPCSWPDHEDIEVDGESATAIASDALDEACRIARRLPDYAEDDRLWVLVWDEDGVITASSSRLIGA